MIKDGLILAYLFVLSVFDGKDKSVPVVLLVPGIFWALIYMVYKCALGEAVACIWGLIPGAALLIVALVTKKAGMADGIVLGIIGVMEGYRAGMLIWGSSMCAMSVVAVVLLCCRRVNRDTRVPYLPFLCGGYLIWIIMLR